MYLSLTKRIIKVLNFLVSVKIASQARENNKKTTLRVSTY